MKKINRTGNLLLFFLTILTTLAACTTTSLPEQENSQNSQYGAMEFYNWVIAATPEAVRQELDRLENNVDNSSGPQSLVKQALLVSTTTLHTTDLLVAQEQRALDLLDQFERHADTDAAADDYHALAHLWRQVLELRQQVSLLREQIEALTTIERKIDNREQQEE